jgi:hypothetical protein
MGCAAPGSELEDRPATRVMVMGSVFDVRVKDRTAQAIRVNRQYAPRLGPIGARAAFAMQHVSGCTVTKLKGDAALLIGTLRCGHGDPVPPLYRTRHGTLECYGIDSFESPATGELITNYDCDWLPQG